MKETCPKCESARWMRGLALSASANISVTVTGGTWLAGAAGTTYFTASICGDCGFTEFYATNPKAVWEEWRKRNA
jgi:predicted nucleic-acid-binding Zn-ribbon protein